MSGRRVVDSTSASMSSNVSGSLKSMDISCRYRMRSSDHAQTRRPNGPRRSSSPFASNRIPVRGQIANAVVHHAIRYSRGAKRQPRPKQTDRQQNQPSQRDSQHRPGQRLEACDRTGHTQRVSRFTNVAQKCPFRLSHPPPLCREPIHKSLESLDISAYLACASLRNASR